MNDMRFLDKMTAQQVFSRYAKCIEYLAIYVPSTMYNQSIDNQEYINKVIEKMSSIFGGATSYYADGGYVADSGELITENIRIVKSYTAMVTAENALEVIKIAEWLKAEMQQECISVEYNGTLMFV